MPLIVARWKRGGKIFFPANLLFQAPFKGIFLCEWQPQGGRQVRFGVGPVYPFSRSFDDLLDITAQYHPEYEAWLYHHFPRHSETALMNDPATESGDSPPEG